ncbi:MAG: alpha/beta fold hydrolase [Polyangiales bacterium]
MTILRSEVVEQSIDRPGGRRGRFVKEVVLARGDVPLCFVRKRSAEGRNDRATLLLVHGFGQNRYTWHLPSRSFVNHLAAAGFDVFNLELRGHGRSRLVGAPRPTELAEYIEEDLPFALEEVRRITGRDDLFLVGHSLGGLIGYAAAPLATGLVRGLVTIGSPYQFTAGSGTLKVIGGLVAALDRLGVPLANVPIPIRAIGRGVRFARRYMESPLYPVRLRGWHAGAIEPDVLAEHLKLAFDLASLQVMVTLFRWSGRTFGGGVATTIDGLSYAERFERCKLPLLVIAGTGDDLAPPASVEPAYLRSRSPDKSYRELPLGHIDLIVGREAPSSTWPIVERWIGARADRHEEAPRSALVGASAGHEDVP